MGEGIGFLFNLVDTTFCVQRMGNSISKNSLDEGFNPSLMNRDKAVSASCSSVGLKLYNYCKISSMQTSFQMSISSVLTNPFHMLTHKRKMFILHTY